MRKEQRAQERGREKRDKESRQMVRDEKTELRPRSVKIKQKSCIYLSTVSFGWNLSVLKTCPARHQDGLWPETESSLHDIYMPYLCESSGNRAELPFQIREDGVATFPSLCLRILTWKEMIPLSPAQLILVIHTPRTGKLIIYSCLTAVCRNTFVRAYQSHRQCEEQRGCPVGESHRNPPNEEIVSRFVSWLLFYRNLPQVCIPSIGQLQRKCPLTPHSSTKNSNRKWWKILPHCPSSYSTIVFFLSGLTN